MKLLYVTVIIGKFFDEIIIRQKIHECFSVLPRNLGSISITSFIIDNQQLEIEILMLLL